MAGGEGGFSQAAMGFNKKEVNDYIAKINQRMKEVEAEKKENDAKTQEALKKAKEADAKIKAAVDEGKKQAAQLEEQLKNERMNSETLMKQIDDLKRKLQQKASADAAGAKNADAKAQAVVAKANEQAKQIIEKANATARDTVEKAKAAATKMVSEAGASGGGVNTAGLDEFMGILNGFISKVTSGVNEVNQKATELLGAQAAAPVTVPDFSNITAPQAETPKAAPAAKAAAGSKTEKAVDDLFALLDDDEPESNSIEEDDLEIVTEVMPLDDPKNAPTAVVLEEFDLSSTGDMDLDLDMPVSEVRPLDANKRGSDHLVDDDFEKQMLAQTANSSSLKNELNDDLLASVRQQEEQFAVKPTKDDVGGLDMDMSEEEEDPMAAMLRQAELAFGGATGASVEEEPEEEKAPAASGGDNPWAALQDELFAMEKSGGLDSSDDDGGSSSASTPAAPSADDSSIWDFGMDSDSGSSDDDMGMSSDLFGNF